MEEHVHRLLHGAGASDGPAVHEKYFVCVFDGVQAVRDDDARGLLRQFFENVLKQSLSDRINVCGSFVEDQEVQDCGGRRG